MLCGNQSSRFSIHLNFSMQNRVFPTSGSDTYYGLDNQGLGHYGKVNYGRTTAITLTGNPEFRAKAFTLFASMGGESKREEWVEARPPILRIADRPDTD